jgi:two-component system, NtrC family, response regulator
VTVDDLQLGTEAISHQGLRLKEARENLEREMLQRAITKSQGNLSKAAEELGISRPTLYELMEKLGIERK